MATNVEDLLTTETANVTSRGVKVSTLTGGDRSRVPFLRVWGTWDGATVTILVRETRNDTFSSIGADAAFKANFGRLIRDLPIDTEIGVQVSGVGGSTSLNAKLSA